MPPAFDVPPAGLAPPPIAPASPLFAAPPLVVAPPLAGAPPPLFVAPPLFGAPALVAVPPALAGAPPLALPALLAPLLLELEPQAVHSATIAALSKRRDAPAVNTFLQSGLRARVDMGCSARVRMTLAQRGERNTACFFTPVRVSRPLGALQSACAFGSGAQISANARQK